MSSATLSPARRPAAATVAAWLERAVTVCLFLLAAAAPHSIAGTQAAWLLAMTFWAAGFLVRPRPVVRRTPVDYPLLGLFCLTFVSALCSYDQSASIGKLRAASLFTIVYVVGQNVRSPRVLRSLVLVLVASCTVNVLYTFGVYAAGRGVKVGALAADSPLRAAGVEVGDTLMSVDGAPVESPEDLVRGVETERPSADKVYRWPDGKTACVWDSQTACVRGYRAEALPVFRLARGGLPQGPTAAARLGLESFGRGRDERARGFFGHYTTYAEALQLVASLALGLLVALRRKAGWRGALLACALAGMCGALILTVTRASWAGFALSAFVIVLAGAGRRALLLMAAVALPLAVAGLFVLQQKRRVGFLDAKDGSTAWRLIVWREGFDILTGSPRHLLVGVGMDSLKRYRVEWGMFDRGRQPWGHLHSTPLQLAFERGLPALVAWLALLYVYARMLWRLARSEGGAGRVGRGLALGALGGAAGFFASGLVHYNLGDSEVVMIFYLVMGLALALERLSGDGPPSPAAGRV
jgi:O-antigen ligase